MFIDMGNIYKFLSNMVLGKEYNELSIPKVFEATLDLRMDNSKYLTTSSLSIIAFLISFLKYFGIEINWVIKISTGLFMLSIVAGVVMNFIKAKYFLYVEASGVLYEKEKNLSENKSSKYIDMHIISRDFIKYSCIVEFMQMAFFIMGVIFISIITFKI